MPAPATPEPVAPLGPVTITVSRNGAQWIRRPRGAAFALGAATAIGLMIVLVVIMAPGQGRLDRQGHDAGVPLRMAVLPFENIGDSADGYFADGMTDAIRNELTDVPGLEVIASSSSNQYKKAAKTPEEIGRELGVRYLLMGKIRWSKDGGQASRVQVSPELVEVTNATVKWGQAFDQPLTDVFLVQGDIAAKIVQQLRINLTSVEERTLARRPTANLEAYVAYLHGLHILNDPSVNTVDNRAAAAFRDAVRMDSNFALAWAAMSMAYSRISQSTFERLPIIEDSARDAAARAEGLNPELTEAHLAQGLYHLQAKHDFGAAAAALGTGLRINSRRSSGRWLISFWVTPRE